MPKLANVKVISSDVRYWRGPIPGVKQDYLEILTEAAI